MYKQTRDVYSKKHWIHNKLWDSGEILRQIDLGLVSIFHFTIIFDRSYLFEIVTKCLNGITEIELFAFKAWNRNSNQIDDAKYDEWNGLVFDEHHRLIYNNSFLSICICLLSIRKQAIFILDEHLDAKKATYALILNI